MNANERAIGSDLAKVDAHVITAEEYEEIPELTDEQMERAVLHYGGKPVKRGGPGWQTRINETLEAAVRRDKKRAGSSSP